ncbi:MAG: hypothetical protein LRZ93_04880 [Clostridiales bacterium]|nr:hypothetical protein [Clostridiales bacterium]
MFTSELFLRLLVSLVQASLILIISHMVFGVTIVGNLFLVAGIVILGALVFISLGYLLISLVNSAGSGMGILQAVQLLQP